jgi:ABC-type sugar transport system substrate-binding protein
MDMKKTIVLFLALVLAFFMACGQKTPGTDSSVIRVGATLQDLGNVYFIDIAKGLEEQAQQLGWKLTIADGRSDAQTQINSIENFITEGVNAIIIAPYDSAALVPYVARAKQKGISVICVTQPVDGYDAWLGIAEREYGLAGGTLAGQWIIDHFPGNQPVEVGIISYPEMETIIDRGEGLKEAILKMAPNAKIVNEQSAATPERGEVVTAAMLQANPNIKVIACINDSGALGALNAVQSAGKATDDFCIVGLDATEEALARIKQGTVLRATVDIAPVQTGRDTIDLAAKVLQSGPIPGLILVKMVPVTTANIGSY